MHAFVLVCKLLCIQAGVQIGTMWTCERVRWGRRYFVVYERSEINYLVICDVNYSVRGRGLEPPRIAPLVPKTNVYTNFTTRAFLKPYGFEARAGIETYRFSTPCGYILLSVESITQGLQSPLANAKNFSVEARAGIEPAHIGFANRCVTTSPPGRSASTTLPFSPYITKHLCYYFAHCRDGVIGSHARLKILWPHGRAGSIPAPGTEMKGLDLVSGLLFW